MIDTEQRRLIDTKHMFGDKVIDKNFAILEHDKTDIFLSIQDFISNVDVDDRFLF